MTDDMKLVCLLVTIAFSAVNAALFAYTDSPVSLGAAVFCGLVAVSLSSLFARSEP